MSVDPVQAAIGLGAVVFFVLLNGFFVATEFAIVKVRDTQIAARAAAGDKRAKLAGNVVEHLDAYLSATQLGITLASLALGWIGEPAVASLIEPPLSRMGVPESAVHTLGFALAFSVITILHIVIGELAPKSLAIQRAEGVTLWSARPIHWFYVLFRPFIWALNGLANLLLRSLGVQPVSEGEMVQSEEELRLIMLEARNRKAMGKARGDVIVRAFDLKDLVARNIMTPRTRMVVLDRQRSFDENLSVAEDTGYTRFPLVDGDVDLVVGMVHYRDLVKLRRQERPRDIDRVKRPVHFVPDTKPVEDTLTEMLKRGFHLAVVTDEHGSTAGILTLEDIFEEIFGEIRDEFDTAETENLVQDLGDGHFVLDGLLPLHQARHVLDVELEMPEVTTLSGYVVASLGRVPVQGERVQVGPYEGVVREVARRRIQTLELWRPGPRPE